MRRARPRSPSNGRSARPGLSFPYQDNISALLHEPSFKRLAGEAVFTKAKLIALRNRAVHEARDDHAGRGGGRGEASCFIVCFWLARTYARADAAAPTVSLSIPAR